MTKKQTIMQPKTPLTPKLPKGKKPAKATKTVKTASTLPRAIRLRTLADGRRFIAKVINDLNRGTIEESKARCYAYLVSTLQSLISEGDIETRLNKLEKVQEKRK